MYLVSLYFDENTNSRMLGYIQNVAEKSGNRYMVERNVTPHITISAFETLNVNEVVEVLENTFLNVKQNKIKCVTVGTFPTVIFIQPVLNEYLHNISSIIYESIASIPDTKVSRFYRTFSWLPHVTIAKQLSEEQMRKAFDVLQKSFSVFEGEIVRIELSKKIPFMVMASWELK